ncbi:hypothetical protein [Mastigocoleus sp. MO_188.B34]|uniref:hypothetical protein n=1 Tax=Mastigocoleus sp. MO_188.B34 TaxID=3036635 RepID=UPI00261D9DC9|nr:hypothetical protein [Mastigocoleus sp. MO_188.B34]MDJ0694175.1 hypothetical protein [Mastigocoleus sp. MO_188.B34]
MIIWLVITTLVFASSSCVPDVQENQVLSRGEDSPLSGSSAESITHHQIKEVMPQNLISAEIEPLPNQANKAALALQRLGFKILHIGSTISVQAPRSLWESTFNVSFQQEKKTVIAEIGSEVTYLRAVTDNLTIPEGLESLISEVMFVEPPEFYQVQP